MSSNLKKLRKETIKKLEVESSDFEYCIDEAINSLKEAIEESEV